MFKWDDGAVKAAKLITGSKKVGLVGAYGLCLWKMAPHVAHWIMIKAQVIVALLF